jgi:hypothetical protein
MTCVGVPAGSVTTFAISGFSGRPGTGGDVTVLRKNPASE